MNYSSGQDLPQASNDQYMDWDGLEALNNSNALGDASSFDPSFYVAPANGQTDGANLAPTSNQLVRRNGNQQLAARSRNGAWEDINGGPPQPWEEEEDENLDDKALMAKRDAQAKRKQIPPFVQKLSRPVLPRLIHLGNLLTNFSAS